MCIRKNKKTKTWDISQPHQNHDFVVIIARMKLYLCTLTHTCIYILVCDKEPGSLKSSYSINTRMGMDLAKPVPGEDGGLQFGAEPGLENHLAVVLGLQVAVWSCSKQWRHDSKLEKVGQESCRLEILNQEIRKRLSLLVVISFYQVVSPLFFVFCFFE